MLENQIKTLGEIFNYLNENKFESKLNNKIVITIQSSQRKNALGWCSVKPIWSNSDDEWFYEINIAAEYLNSGILNICEVMLHEMCHLANLVDDISDCNAKTQYHNKKFKAKAESVGLVVEKDKRFGYGFTSLSEELENEFKNIDIEDVFNIKRGLPIAEGEEGEEKEKKKRAKNIHKYICPTCQCDVKSKISGLEITCKNCEVEFEEEKEEEESGEE